MATLTFEPTAKPAAALPQPAVALAQPAAALAQPAAASLDDPHVWLGLPADETCPGRIADAARRRLDAIRDAGGAEESIKEAVIRIIVAARQALLARAREATHRQPAPAP
jgi:hypothetical protein